MTPTTQADVMLHCEAQEWIERVRREGHSRASGQKRMAGILADIADKRGQVAADRLRAVIDAELKRQRAVEVMA
jgi:hypothetical protein